MQPMKRVEIVVSALDAQALISIIERHGLSWTRMRDVSGHGERGERTADDPVGALKNNLVITVCAPGAETALVADIRPILSRSGGMCIVTDCMYLMH